MTIWSYLSLISAIVNMGLALWNIGSIRRHHKEAMRLINEKYVLRVALTDSEATRFEQKKTISLHVQKSIEQQAAIEELKARLAMDSERRPS